MTVQMRERSRQTRYTPPSATRSARRQTGAKMASVRFMPVPGYFPQEQPGFLQAHFAWSVQQVQDLPLSQTQAFSLAQLHLSPHTQLLPFAQSQALAAPHAQHPENTTANTTATDIMIALFISASFRFGRRRDHPLSGTPNILSWFAWRSVMRMSNFQFLDGSIEMSFVIVLPYRQAKGLPITIWRGP